MRRRGGETARLPLTPELAADGGGRIGVQLSTNASLSRRVAAGPGQALAMAGGEFRKLLNVVTTGAGALYPNLPPGACHGRRRVPQAA